MMNACSGACTHCCHYQQEYTYGHSQAESSRVWDRIKPPLLVLSNAGLLTPPVGSQIRKTQLIVTSGAADTGWAADTDAGGVPGALAALADALKRLGAGDAALTLRMFVLPVHHQAQL